MTSLAALHGRQASGGRTGRSALWRAGAAAAALATCAAAATAGLGGGTSAAVLSALAACTGVVTGQLLGRRNDTAAKAARILLLRVADELVQYRAFTRLLRDQGARIVESTASAAMSIIAGLTEMDAATDRMRLLIDRSTSDDAEELRSLLDTISAPVTDMLAQLQFQDMTQQQIAFLSRLSVMLDEHMVQLARHLGDRRASERLERFRKMFDDALGDCVMDGQRDDHHAASGLARREDAGQKLELF